MPNEPHSEPTRGLGVLRLDVDVGLNGPISPRRISHRQRHQCRLVVVLRRDAGDRFIEHDVFGQRGPHQAHKRGRRFQRDRGAGRMQRFQIADELKRVSEALLAADKDGPAGDRKFRLPTP